MSSPIRSPKAVLRHAAPENAQTGAGLMEFEKGQEVLVVAKNKHWCEAKIVDVNKNFEEEGKKTVGYRVHYPGWKASRFDEWVAIDCIMLDTPENENKAEEQNGKAVARHRLRVPAQNDQSKAVSRNQSTVAARPAAKSARKPTSSSNQLPVYHPPKNLSPKKRPATSARVSKGEGRSRTNEGAPRSKSLNRSNRNSQSSGRPVTPRARQVTSDDGEETAPEPSSNARPSTSGQKRAYSQQGRREAKRIFATADDVRVKFKGELHEARVLRVEVRYFVRYADSPASADQWITEDKVSGPPSKRSKKN